MATQLSALASPLSDSAEWVMRQQSRDGCFYPVGELLHQELRVSMLDHHVDAVSVGNAVIMTSLSSVCSPGRWG